MSEFTARLEQTRKKLLDLTRRNKLLNYHKPAKSRYLRIIDESPQFIYNFLVVEEKKFKFKYIPEPELLQLEYKQIEKKKEKLEKIYKSTPYEGEKKTALYQIEKLNERIKENELSALLTAEEQAVKLGFDISGELPAIDLETNDVDLKYTDDYLQTLHYPSDLEKILKKLELGSRNIIEETGSNMLYMILGVLEWFESNNSNVKFKSPLISIPVTIKRGSLNKKTNTYDYTLEYNGESIDTNQSLAEKLKQDFNIELPELVEEFSFNEYVAEVRKVCSNHKNWVIRQEVSLDFLQFNKILMYKDLDPVRWNTLPLDKNKVLQDFFLGREDNGISYAPDEYMIDSDPVAQRIPLVLDADSSQHSAIADVLKGKNIVVEGPPGTGKSQTIANMIAVLIAEGKNVLFVSEKMAALDVVHKRLSSVGLDDFCLELHSHKTQKLKVLDSIKYRIKNFYPMPAALEIVKSQLIDKKKKLTKYINLIHTKIQPIDLTIFDILWKAEKYKYSEKYLSFNFDHPGEYTLLKLIEIQEEISKFVSYNQEYDFNNFYWKGVVPKELDFISIDTFLSNLEQLQFIYKQLDNSFQKLFEIGHNASSTLDISNESNEAYNITRFLESSTQYRSILLPSLLNKLQDPTVVEIYKNLVKCFYSREKICLENQKNIVNYDSLTLSEINFITQLDTETIINFEKKFVNPAKDYHDIINKIGNSVKVENIEQNYIDAIQVIDSFLYTDISIEILNQIVEKNEEFLKVLLKIERLNRNLSREFDIQLPFDIFGVKNIQIAMEKLVEIEKDLFVNSTEEVGTSKYDESISLCKSKIDSLNKKIDTLQLSFQIDKINNLSISDLEFIKKEINDKKDSFFKIFSKDYKQAVTDLEKLTNSVLSKDKNEWINNIENALIYKKELEEFNSNEEYENRFKSLFKGLTTDWKLIEKINSWAKNIRCSIKSQKIISLLLSGNEQVYFTLSSSSQEYSKNVEKLFGLSEEFEILYKQNYLTKLYHNFEDCEISTIKTHLESLNEKITNYLDQLDNKIPCDIQINTLLPLLKNYFEYKELYEKGREYILEIISNFMKNNTSCVEDFVEKIVKFFTAQAFDSEKIKNMLQNEVNTNARFEELSATVRKYYGFDSIVNDEAINLIEKHFEFINFVENSLLNEALKKLIFVSYENIFACFDRINKLFNDSFIVKNNIMNLATIEDSFFEKLHTYEDLSIKVALANENRNKLSVWIDYHDICKKIKSRDLENLIHAVDSKKLPLASVLDTFLYNFYNSLVKEVFIKYPKLKGFTRVSHEESIKNFRELDKQLLELNKEHVSSRASQKIMPSSQTGGSVKQFTNMRLLENEISKKKRHIPIRQLLNRSGKAIQALKPCFMMSPLSVAQYLAPDVISFDVVLIDEASQLRPEEALGVIARTSQIVIVGDPKQLPPTSFFDNVGDELSDDDETILGESESILDTCIDVYSPIRRLKWHYRSQHESLIDFSNKHFYDNDLITFPSPTSIYDSHLGVKYTYVENAIYQSGANQRFNKQEAKTLVNATIDQMKTYPDKSLGIGTLNTSQRDLIQQMIDEHEKLNIFVAQYIQKWKDTPEPFFIKNLESLQGDERDVIYISTTYGPDKETKKVMQRFGPVNQDMGWRRLNVLFTRAKQKMHIFTSMLSNDIKITSTSSKGVVALKSFLKYLETGIMTNQPEITERGFDSPFEESVYQLLSDIGIKAVPQVGVAGYYIDLAVKAENSNDFVLAIECDGATYHSSKSARDRDRLKDEVLNNLGWKVYRIWSVDWYKNRDYEIEKLIEIIQEQQKVYAHRAQEKGYINKSTTPTFEKQVVDQLNEMVKDKKIIDIESKIIDDKPKKISKTSELFYDDKKIKQMLLDIRENEIAKEFEINDKCLLSPVMIDQFIKNKPIDMDEFRGSLSLMYRTAIDRNQLKYINKIFEILEMAE